MKTLIETAKQTLSEKRIKALSKSRYVEIDSVLKNNSAAKRAIHNMYNAATVLGRKMNDEGFSPDDILAYMIEIIDAAS